GTDWSFFPPTASGSCCTNPLSIQLLSSNNTVLGQCQSVWTAVWQATDCCSNVSTCTQTVTVVDTTAPFFDCVSPGPNLVPNPGFESFTSCPNSISQLNLAAPWFQPTTL